MTEKEVLKMALEFVEDHLRHWSGVGRSGREVVAAIKEALAQPEQEPVAWIYEFYADMGHKGLAFEEQHSAYNTPLYSTPPQRTWVGLTKEDKWEIVKATERDERNTVMELVEAKLKEKNT